MADWFNFALYALQQLVSTLFQLDTGLGFTLGDVEIALLVIGIVATALIVRIGSGVFSHDLKRGATINRRSSRSSSHASCGIERGTDYDSLIGL